MSFGAGEWPPRVAGHTTRNRQRPDLLVENKRRQGDGPAPWLNPEYKGAGRRMLIAMPAIPHGSGLVPIKGEVALEGTSGIRRLERRATGIWNWSPEKPGTPAGKKGSRAFSRLATAWVLPPRGSKHAGEGARASITTETGSPTPQGRSREGPRIDPERARDQGYYRQHTPAGRGSGPTAPAAPSSRRLHRRGTGPPPVWARRNHVSSRVAAGGACARRSNSVRTR